MKPLGTPTRCTLTKPLSVIVRAAFGAYACLRRFGAGTIHTARTVVPIAGSVLALGCRGQPSTSPPFHLLSDMQQQPKYLPQSASPFFSDGAGMRMPPHGVVATGDLREDDAYYRGRGPDGAYVARIPVSVDDSLIARGQERFDIFCSPCHDKAGSGHGIVPRRGFPAPIDLASDHSRGLADGEIFDVMTSGVRNMPAYRFQVPVADRWAIVSWVRVLQRSQHATLADVAPALVPSIEPEGANP